MTATSPRFLAAAESLPWTDFRRRLLSFVKHRTADVSDAEDIVQSVLARAAGELEAGRQHGDLTAWLFQMTRNALTDHYRRGARRRRHLAAFAEESGFIAETPSAEPPGFAAFAGCVRPMVAALPEPYRTAVRRVDLESAAQVDLATELGLSVSGAKSRVQRGRAMLREAFLRCCVAERGSGRGVKDVEHHAEGCRPNPNTGSCGGQNSLA